MKIRDVLWIFFLSNLIYILVGLLTNPLQITGNWDSLYYIDMARNGFNAHPLASPFSYRYLLPFVVHGMTFLGVSVENGFHIISYIGITSQLTGIFFFVEWISNSRKGAYLAMTITALSLYNVKFLIHDVFRPDHLAYAVILLQTYLALRKNFLGLLILTLVASQMREFNIIPLAAYLIMQWRQPDHPAFSRELIASLLILVPAIVLPRILIPVTENFQVIGSSLSGIVLLVTIPFTPSIVIPFLFSIAAYTLPLFMLTGFSTIKRTFLRLDRSLRDYLSVYIILVFGLSLVGGIDLFRFATYLFLPQIILIGFIAPADLNLQMAVTVASTFVFNKIWMHFPDWDRQKYRDFYGGYATGLNAALLYRSLEYLAFLVLGHTVNTFAKANKKD